MANVFLTSDTHFGHRNICKFMRSDGITPLRPWDDVDVMDTDMVMRWNKVVGPNDKVMHLGDVVINRKSLAILNQLNGRKELIMGNHDIFDHTDYLKYFKRLHGSYKLGDLWLTHIPVHIDSVPRWATANVHGHIHANLVMRTNQYHQQVIDSRYANVSVEHTDYAPIPLDSLHDRIKDNIANFPVDRTIHSVSMPT